MIDFAVKATADQLSPPETTRRLVYPILDFQDEWPQDDATVLLAEGRSLHHHAPTPNWSPRR